MNSSMNRAFVITVVSFGLTACSSMGLDKVLPDKNVEYKREKIANNQLEIPPDLTSDRINNRISGLDTPTAVSTSYSEYETKKQGVSVGSQAGMGSAVLPEIEGIRMQRVADDRWLEIDSSAENVWNGVLNFWQENGILLEEQDAAIGTMRTGWLENVAGVKSDFLTDAIRSALPGLYDAGTRDKYRVRLERTADGKSTELFLTHFDLTFLNLGNKKDNHRLIRSFRLSEPPVAQSVL